MPLPRSFASGLWLAATVASTGMVWTATSIVAADVTDRPARVLAHQEVVSALESGPSSARAAPTSTTPKPTTTTSTLLARSRGPAPTTPGPPAPGPPPPQPLQPGATIPALPPAPTPTTAPAPRPVSPPPTQAPRPTATYSTPGGVVGVACNGFFIDLISAIPSNGYAVNVIAGGPVNVDVHFRRAGQDLSVKVVCFGQPIRYFDDQVPQRPRSALSFF